MVSGSGFRVQGSGFRAQGAGKRLPTSDFPKTSYNKEKVL